MIFFFSGILFDVLSRRAACHCRGAALPFHNLPHDHCIQDSRAQIVLYELSSAALDTLARSLFPKWTCSPVCVSSHSRCAGQNQGTGRGIQVEFAQLNGYRRSKYSRGPLGPCTFERCTSFPYIVITLCMLWGKEKAGQNGHRCT